ncbi:hypothetical protein BDBG_16744 [Blastomyces gilchristii SLH14081]|uniref:Uncharacterized protein n=1 Tax=Blastomyces gilchristii (strain SLH14081) TaxID=559298 RepID=A0A179UGR9_BLAGS|nr:uncharacterized protein BDBG_16744 [Blastomyces gilchristii SLH14081]OAT06943.1 hypothetical protein BDBG_16744 [Blastomyces gilchristii SLH14081]
MAVYAIFFFFHEFIQQAVNVLSLEPGWLGSIGRKVIQETKKS